MSVSCICAIFKTRCQSGLDLVACGQDAFQRLRLLRVSRVRRDDCGEPGLSVWRAAGVAAYALTTDVSAAGDSELCNWTGDLASLRSGAGAMAGEAASGRLHRRVAGRRVR